MAVKARAFIHGRTEANVEDVRSIAHPVLRHRLVMNPDAKNFGYTSDDLIDDLLRKVEPTGELPSASSLQSSPEDVSGARPGNNEREENQSHL
jgi:hypothetical protein